ncbi:MAG: STAS domain-containing protein [Planctomycetota bacterium]|jgi:anti-sigma B factor antagonist
MSPTRERIFVEHTPDVTTVTLLDTQLLEQKDIQELQDAVMVVVDTAMRQTLILDFCNIKLLSSSALGFLVKLQKKIGEKKAKLQLQNINSEILKVFKITKLDKLFVIKNKGG